VGHQLDAAATISGDAGDQAVDAERLTIPAADEAVVAVMALLVQTLDGATTVTSLPGTETARIYRFTKDGRFVWVVWSDAEEGETVHVDTGAATRVRITDAVPAAELGEDVDDPATAFPTREEAVSGSVALELGLSPVFVEEIR
jgi:hypothetical protein